MKHQATWGNFVKGVRSFGRSSDVNIGSRPTFGAMFPVPAPPKIDVAPAGVFEEAVLSAHSPNWQLGWIRSGGTPNSPAPPLAFRCSIAGTNKVGCLPMVHGLSRIE